MHAFLVKLNAVSINSFVTVRLFMFRRQLKLMTHFFFSDNQLTHTRRKFPRAPSAVRLTKSLGPSDKFVTFGAMVGHTAAQSVTFPGVPSMRYVHRRTAGSRFKIKLINLKKKT